MEKECRNKPDKKPFRFFRKVKPDKCYDPVELKRGTKVEDEHTPNKRMAKVIAKHHLDEVPNYYSGLNLEQFEKDYKRRKENE